MIEKLVIRRATCADNEAVLDINKHNAIYEGFDPHPQMYFWTIHTKNNFPFVGIIDGKVVAFCNCQIIDNGRTLYVGASRVAEEYQRQGINQVMTEFTERYIRDRFPDVKTKSSIFIQSDINDNWIAKVGYQTVYEWHMMRYKTDPESLKAAVRMISDPTHSETLSTSSAIKLIPDTQHLIIKHNKHFVCTTFGLWLPSRDISEANLRVSIMSNDVIASFRGEQRHLEAISFMATQANSRETTTRTNIFFYGDEVRDLLDHLKSCLKKLASVMDEHSKVVGVYVHFAKNLNFKQVHDFLPSVLHPMHPADAPNTGQLAYCDI